MRDLCPGAIGGLGSWLASADPQLIIILIGAGIVLGVAGSAAPVYFYGKSVPRYEARSEAALEALKRVQIMENIKADFRALPDGERCLVFMRNSGLSDELCEER